MLLFVQRRFADLLASGQKTIEIRAGPRYRHLRAGCRLSINGRLRLRVAQVETYASRDDLVRGLAGRFAAAGLRDEADARRSLASCYPLADGPWFLLLLEREPEAARGLH